MAGPGTGFEWTYIAGEDLTSSQYCVVVAGRNANTMALPSAAGDDKILGVLQDAPKSGQAGRVRKGGISTVIAGDDVNRGDLLEIANKSGHVRPLTGANDVVGIAEEDASEGDEFRAFILLLPVSQIIGS